MKKYFRAHAKTSASFSHENAFNAAWGLGFWNENEEALCEQCLICDSWEEEDRCSCPNCGGQEYTIRRGYSCWETAEQLAFYFSDRGEIDDEHADIVIFYGEEIGVGYDGEPLVVPCKTRRPRFLKPSEMYRILDGRK